MLSDGWIHIFLPCFIKELLCIGLGRALLSEVNTMLSSPLSVKVPLRPRVDGEERVDGRGRLWAAGKIDKEAKAGKLLRR